MADSVEFIIKLQDQLSPVASREAAALRQLDAQIRQAEASLKQLESREASFKAGATAAFDKQVQVVGDLETRLASAHARVQELSNSGTPPGMLVKAKELAADLAGKLDEAKAKMRGLEAKAAGGRDPGAVEGARKEIDALKALRPGLAQNAQAAEAAAAKHKAFAQGLESVGGPAQGLHARLGNLKEALATTGGRAGVAAGAIGILIAALLALTVAAGAAYTALVTFGFAAAGAARDARILGEALTGSAELGAEFNAIVSRLAATVPLAKEQIAALAQEMSLLRLGRRDLQAGLTSVAIVTAAIGDAAGNAVKSIVQSSAAIKRFTLGARDMYGEFTALAGTGLNKADILGPLAKQLGVSIREAELRLLQGRVKLADGLKAMEAAVKARFGKTLAAQMLSFDVQVRKAKENLAGMFKGIDIEPALRGLRDFLSVLDQSTVTGKALKVLLSTALGGFASTIAMVAPLGKAFLQGMIIAALKLYLALRPAITAIGEFIAGLSRANGASAALTAGKAIFYGIAVAIGLVVALVGAVVAAFTAAASLIVGPIAAVIAILYKLGGVAAEMGAAVISGLIGAITGGASAVWGAVKNLASGIAGSFKAALGIASPSKLFESYGDFTVQGFVRGIEGGEADAQGAVDSMVGPPRVGGGAPGPAAGGNTIVVQNMYVQDARDFIEQLQTLLRASVVGSPAEAGA